jgi:hypothetical protein
MPRNDGPSTGMRTAWFLVLLKHAEDSLKHAKASEKEHAEQHGHMTESVKQLQEAIEHAKAGHAEVATKHTEEAPVHMRKSTRD